MRKLLPLLSRKRYLVVLLIEAGVFLLLFLISMFVNEFRLGVIASLSAIFITGLICVLLSLINKHISKSNKRFYYAVILSVSLLGLIIYSAFVFGRNAEYTGDHTCYFNQQNELTDLFVDSQLKGLCAIVSSFWYSDYSYFINVFLELPFLLLPKAHETYIVVYYFVFIIPVFAIANVFVFFLAEKIGIVHKKTFVFLCNITMLFFPLIHFASLQGMPDVFGIFFVFAILIVLLETDFSIFEYRQAFLLSGLVVALAITRRWYIFWMIGALPSFLIVPFLIHLREKKSSVKTQLLNLLKLCSIVIISVAVLLFPFIYTTLFVRNYREAYSEWYLGGFPYEVYNQIGYLGVVVFGMILCGLVYGIVNSRLRELTIPCVMGLLLSMFSFTLIQNMGKHQSLCLVPYYIIFLFALYVLIDRMNYAVIRNILVGVVVFVFAINVCSSLFAWVGDINGLFLTTKYPISSGFQWK